MSIERLKIYCASIGDQFWDRIWQGIEERPSKDDEGIVDTLQHLPWLFVLGLALSAKRILDIGLRFGNTAYTFCRVCEFTQGTVESVEPYPHLPTVEWFKRQFGQRWRLHIGKSEEVLPRLLPGYDLICIDGCHERETVMADLFQAQRLIRKGGVVVLHDTVNKEGVKNAYAFFAAAPAWVACGVTNCYGLGMLWRKE